MFRLICRSQRCHLIYLNDFCLKLWQRTLQLKHKRRLRQIWNIPILFFTAFTAVSAKNAGQGKFTQLMSNHFFGNEHLIEHLPVMDEERMPYKFRHNGTSPCPSFDRLFFADGLQFLDLPVQFGGNERTFFN